MISAQSIADVSFEIRLQVDAERTADAGADVLYLKVKNKQNENAYIDYYVVDAGVVNDSRRVLPYEIILHVIATEAKPGVVTSETESSRPLGRRIIHKYESFEVRTEVPTEIFKWGAHNFEGDMHEFNMHEYVNPRMI